MEDKVENQIVAATPKKEVSRAESVRAVLEKMKPQMALALPKHITPDRMLRIAMTACQQNPKLYECEQTSLLSAIMKAAQLGLEPDGALGQAYLIPFGNKVTFIPGYKGLIDLARRSGEVTNIIAKEVYENDEFAVDFSQEVPFVHRPLLNGDRGALTHFWAMARFKDGGFHWDYMTKEEVEKIRDNGQGKNNDVWKKHFVEMGKKTAIRRIAKYLPMSVQKAALVNDLVDAGKKFDVNDFGDIVIEGSVEEINSDAPRLGNEAVKEKLKKKAADTAGADPETGEVKSDKPVAKMTRAENLEPGADPDIEEETIEVVKPTFDINAYPLKTQADLKNAVTALCDVLAHYEPSERGSIFLQSGGNDLCGHLRRAGIGPQKERFTALGIKLAE